MRNRFGARFVLIKSNVYVIFIYLDLPNVYNYLKMYLE